MIKPALLIKLLKQRLAAREAFVGPIPAEATSDKPQFVIDAYREAAKNEIAFLRLLLKEATHE